MTREVDLVSYLPPFMAEYREIAAALDAEDPEFRLAWERADGVLKNEFIATADEYGISRFEKLLGICPPKQDTLESRRARAQIRWLDSIPYTWRVFLDRLTAVCGGGSFKAEARFAEGYLLELDIYHELHGQAEELGRMAEAMLPANVALKTTVRTRREFRAALSFGFGAAYGQEILARPAAEERSAHDTAKSSRGFYCRTHIKTKRVKED